MQNKLMYPCVIRKEDNVYYADFINFESCFTDGETLEEVVVNAKDVLAGVLTTMIKNGDSFPKSDIGDLKLSDDEFLMYIEIWTPPIFEKVKNQAVKKTLTIPKWLNDEAEKHSLNFSNILQTALKDFLGV